MIYNEDSRCVMTLDAGGTNFVFSAIQANEEILEPIRFPSNADNLNKCLETIVAGFTAVKSALPTAPTAISFCFPGPADYPLGIIGDLINLPAFRGGVPLGPMLEEHFKIPVYINNDGDLFTYGEALAGILPEINGKLRESGSGRQFHNLLGITLGTGFGGGIVTKGLLLSGDNSAGGEVCQLRNKLNPDMTAEEGISIRAIKRFYSQNAGIDYDQTPDPKEIARIAKGEVQGDTEAAARAYQMFGEVLGDSICNVITLVDGLVVLGGGIMGASSLFMDSVLKEMHSKLTDFEGTEVVRITQKAYNLDDPGQFDEFIKGRRRTISIPGTDRTIEYDNMHRTGIARSKLGTSKAISLGAYNFALSKLDEN